jgi:hypothetical protein
MFQRIETGMLAALFLAGCSSGPAAPILEPCADDQEVTLAVGVGLRPVFTWAPACAMSSIFVAPASGVPASWVLYSRTDAPANPLRSGVPYGEEPEGSVEAAPEATLQPGTLYEVTVYRWVGDPGGPGSIFPRGTTTFRP